MRVLIVEDSVRSRTLLEKSLGHWGYEPVSADNVYEAFQMFLSGSIQMVITEWIMPEGDGLALCRRIRALNQPFYTYIILMTSVDDAQSLLEGMDAGADDFVHKPVRLDELHVRIRSGERVLNLEKTLQARNAKLQEISNTLLAAQEIINHDLQLAGNMQRGLLPAKSSNLQGVAIDSVFRPSTQVSGDIFNFFRLDEEHIGFYSIDVSGHGVAAAMLSFTLSRLLTPEMNRNSPLKYSTAEAPYYGIVRPASTVIAALNQQFQTDAVNSLYFTMIYGIIDTSTRTMDICQAGHPHPIYMRCGDAPELIGEGGFPVGIAPYAEYESIGFGYQAGDRLFIYSDGITECTNANGEMFGVDRLLSVIEDTRHLRITETLDRLDQLICAWRGGAFEDDISILALEIVGTH
ncbi:MAG: PP2C family protein-serine/threonine phosphatase [Gammaproteobacteria bacterium]